MLAIDYYDSVRIEAEGDSEDKVCVSTRMPRGLLRTLADAFYTCTCKKN